MRLARLASRSFVSGLALWALAAAAVWPHGVMFRDEVGYVGQARLALDGHLAPLQDSICYSFKTTTGEVAAYPPAFPLAIAPLRSVGPRTVFASGLMASLVLAWEAGRRMRLWGHHPAAGLIVLLYPTVAVLSRSVMTDLWLAALTLMAWRMIDEERRWGTFATLSALVLVKPTGLALAAVFLSAHAAISLWAPRFGTGRSSHGTMRFAWSGFTLGLAVALALNFAATGSIAYAYVNGAAEFGLGYLTSSGPLHLLTLVAVPPGLGLGFVALVRRRAFPILTACVALIVMMSTYYFVDRGTLCIESAVLSPRLILPAVIVLILGLADMLARHGRIGRLRSVAVAALLVAVSVTPLAVARVTAAREKTQREALRAAEDVLERSGGLVLGATPSAFKVAVMSKHPVVWAYPGSTKAGVVLCATASESHRAPRETDECTLAGYRPVRRIEPYQVLSRAP